MHAIRMRVRRFRALLLNPAFFEKVRVQPGGYGIGWNEDTVISDQELYRMGTEIPLSAGDFCRFVERNLVSSAEAANIPDCSRLFFIFTSNLSSPRCKPKNIRIIRQAPSIKHKTARCPTKWRPRYSPVSERQ